MTPYAVFFLRPPLIFHLMSMMVENNIVMMMIVVMCDGSISRPIVLLFEGNQIQ